MSSPPKIGAAMYIGASVLLLLLLTLLFDDALEHQRNPNPSPTSEIDSNGNRTIVLQRNRAGHYVFRGDVNGVPVEFLLDTGATDVAVPAPLAKRIGLKRGAPIRTVTANGYATAHATTIEHLSVGDIREHNVRASIIGTMPGNQILLGMSFLKRLDFSQRGDTLILTQAGNSIAND